MENQNNNTDQLQAAKDLLEAEEKKQGDAAVAILKKAVEEIDKLGFMVMPCGEFTGNTMKSGLKILKKQV